MFKRRRAAAPAFRTPMPFNPQTGQHATIGRPHDPSHVSYMRVKTVYGDYLECEGWEPEIGGYNLTVNVAKPPLLRDSNSRYVTGAGNTAPIKKVRVPCYDEDSELAAEYNVEITYEHDQQRTATHDELTNVPERVWPPYFPGDILLAAKVQGIVGQTAIDVAVDDDGLVYTPADRTAPDNYPMTVMRDSSGKPIWWQDLNIAGRTWRADDSPLLVELEDDVIPTDTSAFGYILGYEYLVTIWFKEPGGESFPHGYGRDGIVGPPRWHNGTFITVVPDWYNHRWMYAGSGLLTDFAGKADGAIAPGASGAVHIWWQDWAADPISLVAGPAVASAINVGGRTVNAGDWISIHYDAPANVHYFQ